MEKHIHSLAHLQKEKERLLMEREICKDEFMKSLGSTKSLALNKIIKTSLSAGALHIFWKELRKFKSSDKNDEPNILYAAITAVLALLPKILPLVQSLQTSEEMHNSHAEDSAKFRETDSINRDSISE